MALVCPKCSAENPEDAYFCGKCHTHIRSVFGAPAALPSTPAPSAPQLTVPATAIATLQKPASPQPPWPPPAPAVSDFAAKAADTAQPEKESNVEARRENQFGFTLGEPTEDHAPAKPAGAPEQTLTLVTDGTRIKWDLSTTDEDPELAELIELERTQATPAAPPHVPPPPAQSQAPPIAGAPATGTKGLPNERTPLEWLSAQSEKSPEFIEQIKAQLAQRAKESLQAAQPRPVTTGEVPDSLRGWSLAGFIPGGVFGFSVGMVPLGLLGLVALFMGSIGYLLLLPLYIVYCGAKGRELLWKNRSFNSPEHYAATLAAWEKAGKVCAWGWLIAAPFIISAFIINGP